MKMTMYDEGPGIAHDLERCRTQCATLLAALRLVDQAENGPWDGAEQTRYREQALAAVRAAIAKATRE